MIISPCRAEGCNALTIGTYCVEHDLPVTRVFVRGRPFIPVLALRKPDRSTISSPAFRVRPTSTISA